MGSFRFVRLLATAALALVAELTSLVGAHEHAFGESDRAPHTLVAIDHVASAAQAHLDLAVEMKHPSCGACLFSSLRGDGRLTPIPALVSGAALEPACASASAVPKLFGHRRAPARAPPTV